MEKKVLRFDGGCFDIPEIKKEDQTDDILNYEYLKNGQVNRRLDPNIFENDLNIVLSEYFKKIIKVFVWYSPNLPDDIDDKYDYLLLFYGVNKDNDEFKLQLFYKRGNLWKYQNDEGESYLKDLYDVGVKYTHASVLRFFSADILLIADGVNIGHFIEVNSEGQISADSLRVLPPTSKISIDSMNVWDDTRFEEDANGEYIDECGLVQYCYTTVDQDGNSSNPSPISDTYDLQWFKRDVETGEDQRWIKRIELNNLKLPEGLKIVNYEFFEIYRAIFRYSAAMDSTDFVKVAQVEIKSRYENGEPLANSYVDTYIPSLNLLSYENNPAPVAKDVCEVGQTKILANINKKVEFPFSFQYFHKIKLQNHNAKTFVDAVIRIRLYDKNAKWEDDRIENLDWSNWITGSGANWYLDSPANNCIRFYDTDSTTPLRACYLDEATEDSHRLDVFIRVPSLLATQTKTIYLCWTNNQNLFPGVNISAYQTAKYGQFTRMEIPTNIPAVFQPRKVFDHNILICSPMDMVYGAGTDEISNKANSELNGTLTNGEWQGPNAPGLARLQLGTGAPKRIGKKCLRMNAWGQAKYYITDIPDACCMFGFFYYGHKIYVENEVRARILGFTEGENKYFSFWVNTDTHENQGVLTLSVDVVDNPIREVEFMVDGNSLSLDTNADENDLYYSIFLAYSLSEKKAYCWVRNIDTQQAEGGEADLSDEFIEDVNSLNPNYFTFGADNYEKISNGFTFDQWVVGYKPYINDDKIIQNIMNFMPPFDSNETIIGYTYPGSNNNILFSETKEIIEESYENFFMFSNKMTFESNFIRKVDEPIIRVIPAPSYLKFEYQNTVLIFTRNGVYRFVLSGDIDTWASSSSNLIPEKKRYGLLAPDSLCMTESAIFWLSEAGVIKWSAEGFRLISYEKIKIPLDKNMIGFFCPLRQQYILHQQYEQVDRKLIIPEEEGLQVIT